MASKKAISPASATATCLPCWNCKPRIKRHSLSPQSTPSRNSFTGRGLTPGDSPFYQVGHITVSPHPSQTVPPAEPVGAIVYQTVTYGHNNKIVRLSHTFMGLIIPQWPSQAGEYRKSLTLRSGGWSLRWNMKDQWCSPRAGQKPPGESLLGSASFQGWRSRNLMTIAGSGRKKCTCSGESWEFLPSSVFFPSEWQSIKCHCPHSGCAFCPPVTDAPLTLEMSSQT